MISHKVLHCRVHRKLPFCLLARIGLILAGIGLLLTGIGTAAGQTQTATQAATSAAQTASTEPLAMVRVDVTPGHVINSFDFDSVLGSSIDVLSRRDIDRVYTPHILQESLSAGWGPITYRNNTELRMAAWHWTPNGTWSDPAHQSGYFAGSTDLQEPIR